MDKPTLIIRFMDFWPSCTYEYIKSDKGFGSTVLKVLSDVYTLSFDICKHPDLIIYSVFGLAHRRYPNVTKIFYTAEYTEQEVITSPLSLSFFPDSLTNFRLPNYERIHGFDCYKKLIKPSINELFKKKTEFCIFIVTNPDCMVRNKFYLKLSKYKKIDSCGKLFNNVNFVTPERDTEEYYELLRRYKFMICFENQSKENYLTEKLYNGMRGHTIPIYWGDPLVHNTFNEKSFINIKDNLFDKAIEQIIKLDNNDIAYINMLKEPYVDNSFIKNYNREDELKTFLINKIS